MTADAQQPEQIVYSKTINVPAKAFPHIVKRKLALNDIGEGDDGFTRIDFELQDGDVIQVVRGSRQHTPAPSIKCAFGTDRPCPFYPVIIEELEKKKIARTATLAECERIYGLFHEVEMLHLNGMAYPYLYNEMVTRIKFIHTEPLSKDGRKKK
jgi:hypothetical protein